MGALSEESAITVSSLSTDLWNNWTKNNTEGISFLFCLSLNLSLQKKHTQTNKQKNHHQTPQNKKNQQKPL